MATESAVTEISAETFRDMLDRDESFVLVDTRDAESFDSWHIEGARNYAYKPDEAFDLAAFQSTVEADTEDTVVTVCAKGISSQAFAEELANAGYEDVRVLEGGMQAWSGVYDRVAIDMGDPTVECFQLQRRAKGCLGYVVGHRPTGQAAVIDPTRHTGEFLAVAEEHGFEITHVFDTHVHADHISGGRRLADETDATYYLGAEATERGVEYDHEPIGRNEVVEVGEISIKALATPGHTSEMVNYLIDDRAILTGDTLFVDSVGRTELQFSTETEAAEGAKMLYESLHRTLLAEPDSVTILPGHFSVTAAGTTSVTPGEPVATTVGAVRTGLDLLQRSKEDFVDHITERIPEKPPNYETVIAVNTGREEPASEQAATELELGPNRCAAE